MSSPENPRIQTYTDLAADYDDIRFVGPVNRRKEDYRREALKSVLPPRAGRALDVACGTGRGAIILHDISPAVVGIDGTLDMLQVARRKLTQAAHRPTVAQANAAALPFADRTFDVITCLNFVHLFSAPQKQVFVREIGRVLKPGGVAVVEFDSAFQGVVLGACRKYFGKDIGYDWPWVIRRCFPETLFTDVRVRGTNLPGMWRLPALRFLERAAAHFPVNYLAARVFV